MLPGDAHVWPNSCSEPCAIAPTSPQANSPSPYPPPHSNLSSPVAEEEEDPDDVAAEVGADFCFPSMLAPLKKENAMGRDVLIKRAKYPTATFKDPTALGWVYTIEEVKEGSKKSKGAARYRVGPRSFNMWFYFTDKTDLMVVS